MRRIVLLRSRAEEDDPYERALRTAGFEAESIPVLRFRFVNLEGLRAALEDRRFGAVVLTSPRAASALERAGLPPGWRGGVAWTVGAETAQRAESLGLRARGDSAGSAEVLAERIVASGPSAPLLFVCGRRRRPVLPERLESEGVAFQEMVAYETELLCPPLLQIEPHAVGFFSPSGVEAAQADAGFPWAARRIAIGPTTAEALAAAGRPAHATAATPTPGAFAQAVQRATAPPSPGA